MYKENPFENSLWIAPDRDIGAASPIIRKRFVIDRYAECVTLFITGLGFFEARINGERVGNEYFQPVASDYEKREFKKILYPCHDSFTHRVYYNTYDVTHLLHDGENMLEIQLGGGWYVQRERTIEGELSFADRCKCIFSLDTGNALISSDGSETWTQSEIVSSELFIGETINPLAADGKEYEVSVIPHSDSMLSPSIGAPDRLIRTVIPKKIAENNGRTIWDVGENVSGVVRIFSKEGFCGKITLRFAEVICNGELDFQSSGAYTVIGSSGRAQIMTDEFIADGTCRTFEPKFVWHAFRYFDVCGEIDSPIVLVIHSDVAVTSSFESDSEGMNYLYDAYIRTELDNMHCSFPSDCPHRERLGYTGDGQITAKATMLMFDSKEFYRKWIRDILDSQDIMSGHVQHTAPFMGGGGGPGGWGSAVVVVPYHYWRHFGDESILRDVIPAIKKWITYLESHMENGLVVREEDGGWCLGDWCTLEKCEIPEPLVNSWYLIKDLEMLRVMCDAAGEPFDMRYESLYRKTLDAIKDTYFSNEVSNYQGLSLYGATLGLVDAEECVKYYKDLGHFDTGIFGTDILCDLLFKTGNCDVFARLLENDELGGYLYMKRRGATTIWESWCGDSSHCHPMLGAPVRQLFEGVLGIRQAEDSCAWREVIINPCLPSGMNFAKGSITTPRGIISVSLKRVDGNVNVDISVPEGISVVDVK